MKRDSKAQVSDKFMWQPGDVVISSVKGVNKAGIAPTKAKHGEKTIEISIRFWTNNIGEGGLILPKHAWSKGTVNITRNEAHGITPKPKGWRPFNSLPELGSAIERVLIESEIVLHHSPRTRKYMAEQPLPSKKT
jgi:hypothetical protein